MILIDAPTFDIEFPDHTSDLRRPREPPDDTILVSFKATFTLPPPDDQYAMRCQRAFSVPLHELLEPPGAQDIAERMLAAVHAPAVLFVVENIVLAAHAMFLQTEDLSEWNPRIAFDLVFVVRELPNIPEPLDDEGDRVRYYAELFDELGFCPVDYAYANDPSSDDEEDQLDLMFNAVSLEFVPASKESIEGLEKVVIKEVSEDETLILGCTICLEDISVGSEATRLPCSHYFHGNCIAEWLGTSKFCPLCRFEMPS